MKTVDLLVLDASEVVTVAAGARGPARGRAAMNDLGVVRVASNAIVAGRIVAIGPTNDVTRTWRGRERVFASGRAVLPGFVDAHTHPVFARWRADEFARRCRGESYEAILAAGGGILASAQALEAADEATLEAGLAARVDEVLRHGTTTMEAKSGYGLSVEAELKSLRVIRAVGRRSRVRLVPTFLGAHAIPAAYAKRRATYVRLVTDVMIPAVAKQRLAAFCDVFCEQGAFTKAESATILRAAARHGLARKIHADEFGDSGGAALAARAKATSAEHLGGTGPAGIRALAKAGVVPVLLPTTSLFLRLAKKPDARAMIDAGCAVALASDFNPGSSPTGNLLLTAALGCSMLGMTPEEAITAITRNAAAAVGLSGEAGTIERGRRADLVVIDADSYVHVPYRLGTNHVRTVVRAGRVVVADGRVRPSLTPTGAST